MIGSAKGSLMMDHGSRYFGMSSTSGVGKGGLVIMAFLDMNCNGKRDPGEPKVSGLNLKLTGGRMVTDIQDSIIRIFDLQPFTSYFIELDGNSFPNIAWQLRNKTISVTTNPNQFCLVEVPVAVLGEASGMVYENDEGSLKGLGRIYILVCNEMNVQVARVLTEADGYYSFPGLSPGKYTVRLDPQQLTKLKFSASGDTKSIVIHRSVEGDLVGNLDFTVNPVNQ